MSSASSSQSSAVLSGCTLQAKGKARHSNENVPFGNRRGLSTCTIKLLGTLLVVTLLQGCASPSGIPTMCLVDQPIMVNDKDMESMTDETAEAITEHNEQWELLCD